MNRGTVSEGEVSVDNNSQTNRKDTYKCVYVRLLTHITHLHICTCIRIRKGEKLCLTSYDICDNT